MSEFKIGDYIKLQKKNSYGLLTQIFLTDIGEENQMPCLVIDTHSVNTVKIFIQGLEDSFWVNEDDFDSVPKVEKDVKFSLTRVGSIATLECTGAFTKDDLHSMISLIYKGQ